VETWDFSVEANQQPFLGAYWEGDWCEVTVAGYDPATGRVTRTCSRSRPASAASHPCRATLESRLVA
jgi:hypothetical protein